MKTVEVVTDEAAVASSPAVPSRRQRSRSRSLLRHALLGAGVLLMLYPVIWMLSMALQPDGAVGTASLIPSEELTLSNFVEGWNALSVSFTRFFLNSILIAVLAIIGNLLACSLTAYTLARLQFRMQPVYFAIVIGTLLMPMHVLLIPQYILFSNLGWLNTYLPLVVPKFLAADAFFVFLMVQFIRGIPRELDQAARIDGAGYFRIYWSIILPLMRSALATTAIFTLIWTWNDFLSPLIYLTSTKMYTVPVALNALMSAETGLGVGRLFAISLLSLVPLIAFFIGAQKHLVRGITSTGLK